MLPNFLSAMIDHIIQLQDDRIDHVTQLQGDRIDHATQLLSAVIDQVTQLQKLGSVMYHVTLKLGNNMQLKVYCV